MFLMERVSTEKNSSIHFLEIVKKMEMRRPGNASLFRGISPSFGQAGRYDCPKDGLLHASVRHYKTGWNCLA